MDYNADKWGYPFKGNLSTEILKETIDNAVDTICLESKFNFTQDDVKWMAEMGVSL